VDVPNLNVKKELKENIWKYWNVFLCWILDGVGGQRQVLSDFAPGTRAAEPTRWETDKSSGTFCSL
jgi:hypothetical protein